MRTNNDKTISFIKNIHNKKVVLFGAGRKGEILARDLEHVVAYFVDNDSNKWTTKVDNLSVHNPSILLQEDKEKIVIIVSSFYYPVISWQLKEMFFVEDINFFDGGHIFPEVFKKEVQDQRKWKEKVWLRGSPYIDKSCVFEGNNVVLDGAQLLNTTMDKYSFVGRSCVINNTRVGRFCSIGTEVQIGLERHPTRGFISTYPAFYMERATGSPSFVEKRRFEKSVPVEIGSDVWIGTRAVILGGVKIGHGAIIGTGAIVTKDVEPYSIVAGMPAKIIRKRYSKEEIALLLEFQWWNKDIEWIKEHAMMFSNEEQFFMNVKKMVDNNR